MSRKTRNKIEQKIITLLKREKEGHSQKELSKALKISKKNYHDFRQTLDSLSANGRIVKDNVKNKYLVTQKSRIVVGELNLMRGGFGFVRDKMTDADIFIGANHLNTAFDGDNVEVKLYARQKGKNQEGFVTKIVQRKRQNFVGTFHETKYYGYVVPDNPKIYRDFFIPQEKRNNAKNGQKVVVALQSWKTDHLNPEAKIIEVLGFPGEPGVDVAEVAHSFELNLKFKEEIELEVANISDTIDRKEIENRLDLRDTICFTIDPSDAKDFDDAVSIEKLPNGNHQIGVHIADVSYYVKINSKIDEEALKRGTSVYLVDRVIPMLPEILSNQICSLQANKDRLTFSCIMEVDNEGSVVHYTLSPSIINSKKRFTYEEVQEIIDKQIPHELAPLLHTMFALSKRLSKKRFDEGGIDFDTPEVSFKLDKNGFPVEINRKERLDSHRLIEEFMLLANKTVSQHISRISNPELKLPFIYRVHEKPDTEKMLKFFGFMHAIGFKLQPVKKMTSKRFQKILETIKGTKEEIVIEEVALRSMMKAVYSIKNLGHFGLGFEEYTHFTSPIRRYPDLVVHRLLKNYAQSLPTQNHTQLSKRLESICEKTTKAERTALEAERESVRLKKNEFISKHIGEEFNGVISGVTEFGIFVELIDTLVEGLVHIKDLDEYFIHDEKTYSLIAKNTKRKLRLGDEIRIVVKGVNLEAGKVDFQLVDNTKKDIMETN